MSPDLFQLLPAVYRIRDAQLAQSQTLLTAAELADLNALAGADDAAYFRSAGAARPADSQGVARPAAVAADARRGTDRRRRL